MLRFDRGLRPQHGNPTAKTNGNPAHPPNPIRRQFAQNYDVTKIGNNWLREVEGAPAQPGPAGSPPVSDQDGHDSAGGSAAHGGRDAPARALQERRAFAAFLPRGPSPAGFHSTGPETPTAAEGGSRRRVSPEARRRAGATCAAWIIQRAPEASLTTNSSKLPAICSPSHPGPYAITGQSSPPTASM